MKVWVLVHDFGTDCKAFAGGPEATDAFYEIVNEMRTRSGTVSLEFTWADEERTAFTGLHAFCDNLGEWVLLQHEEVR